MLFTCVSHRFPCVKRVAGVSFGGLGRHFMLERLSWIAVMSVLAAPAWAQSGAVARCSGIADPAARLACYDAAQPPQSAAPTASGASRYPEFNRSPRTQT